MSSSMESFLSKVVLQGECYFDMGSWVWWVWNVSLYFNVTWAVEVAEVPVGLVPGLIDLLEKKEAIIAF